MKRMYQVLGTLLTVGLLSLAMAAQSTTAAGRYDSAIQANAAKKLASKAEFRGVQVSAEDGIITLTGTVDLYQQKLDAAKKVHKLAKVQGVRNLIQVEGKTVADNDLTAQLDRKLYYDRMGLDVAFNYVTASVDDGVVTLDGAAREPSTVDSALAIVNRTPGVKDVVDNVKVLPPSPMDDHIRLATMRAIYRDPVLSRYAIDPAKPIRIVVDGGHVTLYGTVMDQGDKNRATIRAGQVVGVFSVKNNLEVEKKS